MKAIKVGGIKTMIGPTTSRLIPSIGPGMNHREGGNEDLEMKRIIS